MKSLNKDSLTIIRDEMNAALKSIGEKHSLSFSVGKCKFSEQLAMFTVEVVVPNEDGKILTKSASDFITFAKCYGLKPEHLGKSFVSGNKTFTIKGLNTRSSKRPIIVSSTDGKEYIFTSETVVKLLGDSV